MYEGVLQMNIPHPHAEKALVRSKDNRIQTEGSGVQNKETVKGPLTWDFQDVLKYTLNSFRVVV